MRVFTALTDVILPVIVVAAVGVVLGRTFDLNIDTLSKVGLYGFTPALAFDSMMNTQISADVGTRLVVAYLLMSLLAAAVAWIVTTRMPTPTRRSITACTIIGNNGNFGLPIALLALGDEGLEMAVVIFVLSLLIMFTVGPLLFGSHGGLLGGLTTVVKLPVTWALAAAGVLRLLDLRLPGGLESGIALLGQAAIPLVLIQLGVQMGASGRIQRTPPVITAVALRAVAVPLLAAGIGLLVGLDGVGLASLVLAAAMPIAVNTLMLARECGADSDTVASSVVASTFLSIPILVVLISALPALTG